MLNDNAALTPAFAKNNVPVVIAANNLWAPYAGVFIQSLLDHAGASNNYDVILFSRDISKENQRLLKGLAAGYANVSVRFYDPSPFFASFHYAEEENVWPLEVFCKIVAPHILNYPGRIIATDIDTLLKTDIARLMDADLGGACVGGVSDAPTMCVRLRADRVLLPSTRNVRARDYWGKIYGWKDYNDLESYKTLICAGILLFDCEKYLREVDAETILSTAERNNYTHPEQDTLNVLMRGKTALIDLAWCVEPPVNWRRAADDEAKKELYNRVYNDSEAFQRASENPYILHWVAKPKPWVCPDVPYGNEWWETALRTPFVGHILSRMADELEKRRQYYKNRYGKEDVDAWDPSPRGIDRTQK